MHPDLPKLLEVQVKDGILAGLIAKEEAIESERATLDVVLDRMKAEIASATRTANDVARRRDEVEQKLEKQRAQHEGRRAKLESERNPRLAAQLLADVELGRSILTQEEGDWMRLAEDATQRSNAVKMAEERLAALEGEQAATRAELAQRHDALSGDLKAARAERETAASVLDRPLRLRYDRLRNSRKTEILVPAHKATCTACNTAIPKSRVGKLMADGILIDGCEMCGAIIYVAEVVA